MPLTAKNFGGRLIVLVVPVAVQLQQKLEACYPRNGKLRVGLRYVTISIWCTDLCDSPQNGIGVAEGIKMNLVKHREGFHRKREGKRPFGKPGRKWKVNVDVTEGLAFLLESLW